MNRLRRLTSHLRSATIRSAVFVRAGLAAAALGLLETFSSPRGRRVIAVGVLLAGVGALVWQPPLRTIEPGTIGVRVNRLTGGLALMPEGPALVLPGVHGLKRYPLRDQVYRPEKS